MIWQSDPPDDYPFEHSDTITGVRFTGRHQAYTRADTWYPYWADDDICYSPWMDGTFGGDPTSHAPFQTMDCSSDSRHWSNADIPGKSRTGQARIIGDDPLNLTVESLGTQVAQTAPYGGRYPCASIVHDGVWYYGTYCLDETDRDLNWDVLGPFMGFRISTDSGKTWTESSHSPADGGIFGESGKDGGKVRIGAPHVVYHGQANRQSPDDKVYLVAHEIITLRCDLN